MDLYRPTWAEIDLDKFASNIGKLQTHIGNNRSILAVVKGNGYGHGALPMAKAAVQCGVPYLGVACLEEAVELREGGIMAPILVMGPAPDKFASDIVAYDLTQCVFSADMLHELSNAAIRLGKPAKIHVKLDTGMGRFGFVDPETAADFLTEAVSTPGIDVEGIFTHLAAAEDPNFEYTFMQFEKWNQFRSRFRQRGLKLHYQHISNSAAGLQHLYVDSSFVRFGLSLYGLYPAPHLKGMAGNLQPVLRLVSRIIELRTFSAGSKISYSGTYTAKEGDQIAIIPVGYSDGVSARLSNKGFALVRGKRAPIVGLICMNQLFLNVTDIGGAAVGDEVVLYGEQLSESISIDEAANTTGLRSHEVLCSLGRHIKRIYLQEGKQVCSR